MQINLFQSPMPSSWSVVELTRYLRDLFNSDANLQNIWVQGEVSNFSRPSSGHWYFTLKDNSAAIKCVMWRNTATRQTFIPHDGEAVQVHGAVSIYEANGVYQLYADMVRPAGEGALYQEFLRLKARLEAEGLFDPTRKRPIPHWPRLIGIVTSPTAAALRDMLNTLQRRYPLVKVILAPTPVQGEEAPAGICKAIQSLAALAQPDVILVARGGGSIEDLWAFNDERVARAIAASPIPIITGIGHETDFTIADFVADLRAPTPTAAAELATPDRIDLSADLADLREQLLRSSESIFTTRRWALNNLHNRLRIHSPQIRFRSDRQHIDDLVHRAEKAVLHQLQLQHTRLDGIQQHLQALDPFTILARGFAIVSNAEGLIVHSVAQVQCGDTLNVRLADGQFKVSRQE